MEHFQHSSDTYFNRELSLIEFNRRGLGAGFRPRVTYFRATQLSNYFFT